MDIGVIFTGKGPGGLILIVALITSIVSYGALLRWIARGGKEKEERQQWEDRGWPFE